MAWEPERDDSGEEYIVCSKFHKSESQFFEIVRPVTY